MDYNTKNITPRLKYLMKEKGLTVEQTAKLAEVDYNTIIKIKNGTNKNPTVKTMIGLCRAFGVTIQSFLEKL